jgi:hypothetical protein
VTRRAWFIVALGAVLALAGARVLISARSSTAAPRWLVPPGLYTHAEWEQVKARAVRRGLDPESLRFVIGGGMETQVSLFTVRTRAGRPCFLAISALKLSPTTCSLDKPVVLFRWADRDRRIVVAGFARRDVTSVAARDRLRWPVGVQLMDVGNAWGFVAGGEKPTVLTFRAGTRVVERVTVGSR